MARMKMLVIAVLVAATAIVVLQNTESVETKLLVATISMPRALLITVAFLAGAVCGILISTRVAKKKARAD